MILEKIYATRDPEGLLHGTFQPESCSLVACIGKHELALLPFQVCRESEVHRSGSCERPGSREDGVDLKRSVELLSLAMRGPVSLGLLNAMHEVMVSI